MNMETNANGKNAASEKKPIAILGAGRLATMLWRSQVGKCGWFYRFNIFRINQHSGRITQHFTSEDITDFAKLVQLLACAMSEDGYLEPDLRDDLSCLASCLADVLGNDYPEYVLPTTPDRAVGDVLGAVIQHFWDDAAHGFKKLPLCYHIYRKLVFVDRWLDGAVRHDEVLQETDRILVEDRCGACPICGKNDGYVDLSDCHWFVCNTHQTRWLADSNLSSTGELESREQCNKNGKKIQNYRIVVPWFPLTALAEASD